MLSLELSSTDQAHNRRVWSEWLRRPDWNRVPGRDGVIRECSTPWEVGVTIADEYWPSTGDVMASDEYEFQEDVEEAVISGCFGLRGDPRTFDPADLPERIRNQILMAARAAKSAPPYDNMLWNLDKNSIAELTDVDDWSPVIISTCLISMWNYDQSPMRGAIMSPRDVARLIADILDAAPQSLLADPED